MNPDPCAGVRSGVYTLNLLLTAAVALTTYFNSPLFREHGVSEALLGVVFAIASLFSILALWYSPRIFNAISGYGVFVLLLAASSMALVGMALISNVYLLIAVFMVQTIGFVTLFFLLDLFLEGSTPSESLTGGMRAFLLTMGNIAWLSAPLVAGKVTDFGGFVALYLLAALLVIPAFFIVARCLTSVRTHHYNEFSLRGMITGLINARDVRNVFFAHFLLRTFFAIMVIYLPIHLTQYAGFDFSDMGLILSIAMLAYVLVEWPAGKLADLYIGEKELMIGGFVLIGLSTMAVPFLTAAPLLIWGVVLFVTRTGAALIEITTESYFFKHIDAEEADTVGAFRMLNPLAYIIGPLIGAGVLLFVPLPFIFLALGAAMLLGVPIALQLVDTR